MLLKCIKMQHLQTYTNQYRAILIRIRKKHEISIEVMFCWTHTNLLPPPKINAVDRQPQPTHHRQIRVPKERLFLSPFFVKILMKPSYILLILQELNPRPHVLIAHPLNRLPYSAR
ncbi:hypothetical protein V8G54_014994, partial [Vigna mungo]